MARDSGLKLSEVFDAKKGRNILTLTPAVVQARSETYSQFCRLPLHEFTEGEREEASRFDVKNEIERILKQRSDSGLK